MTIRHARALLAIVLLLGASPAAAADPCASAVSSGFAACLERTAKALRACATQPGGTCAAPVAATQITRKVVARCEPGRLRDLGFAPPFDATVLAARLEAGCRANALLLVERGIDALPDASPACLGALTGALRRLVVGTLKVRAACGLAGAQCNAAKTATKLAAVDARARRMAARRCLPPSPSAAALDGVFARATAQTTCALAQAVPGSGTCAPAGAEALVDLWRLPTPRPAGTRVAQVSSYDRTGANFDQGVGPDTVPYLVALGIPPLSLDNSFLYEDGGRFVVFDEVGPGVVWRIWTTGLEAFFGSGALGGDIAVEVDGETTVQHTRTAFFAGTTPPFLAPFAGDWTATSGAFYSVVPMPFARRLRISTSLVPNWLQVTYSKTPPDQAVASFDPAADLGAVRSRLAAAGDPSTTITPTDVGEVTPSIPHGATQTIWQRTGAASIVRLELLAPAGADIPVGLRLRATFDGAPTPQVDAPLDDLFGASLGSGARSIAFGRDGDRFYCYFPMPFSTSARIDVENQSGAPFDGWTFRVGAVADAPPGARTHFHARARSASLVPDGQDYVILDTAGAGHVVGLVMTAACAGVGQCELPILIGLNGTHLEGDERTTIDGNRWPQIHGTGLEDVFNGGFYFATGPVRLPTHGNPAQVASTSPRRPGVNLRSAYRMFLGEAMPFENHIRVAVEHGGTNDVPAEFSTLVFWYARSSAVLTETDHVVIGDPASEAAHGLASAGRSDVALTSAFRGDASDTAVTASGMTATTTRLTVAVDPANEGVRLRRLADIGAGAQVARVSVDGAFAGVWHTTEVNPTLRWAELELELPAALTAGRAQLTIDIDATASPTPWTAFDYTVLSHQP